MRSVFDGSFVSNLRRISFSGGTSPTLKNADVGNDAAFEQVLKDLVAPQKPALSRDLQALAPNSKSASVLASWSTSDLLTNLPPASVTTLTDAISTRMPAAPSVGTITKPNEKNETTLESIVKEPTHSVKNSSVKTPSVQNSEPSKSQTYAVKNESAATVIRSVTRQLSPKSAGEKLSTNDLKHLISKAGDYHGVDGHLGIAVAETESNFDTTAVSSDGYASKGLFQLLDSTGVELQQNLAASQPYDPFNPRLNAYLGVGYLKQLMDSFSKETVLNGGLKTTPAKSTAEMEKLAVAAFNAGIGNVARAQSRAKSRGLNPTKFDDIKRFLPEITRRYVTQVVNRRHQLASAAVPETVG